MIVAIYTLHNANAANRYVDKDATGSNNGTSWENAWTSLVSIKGASSGDVVYISGGTTSKTYTAGFPVSIPPNVTVRVGQASPHNGTAILDGQNSTNTAFGIAGSNITINGNDGAGNRHIKIYRFSGESFSNYGSGSDGLMVTYLEFDTVGNGIVAIHSLGMEISYCYFHNVFGNGSGQNAAVRITSSRTVTGYGQAASVHHNEIQINGTFDGAGNGSDGVDGSQGVDLYNNHIYGAPGSINGGHQDGIQAAGSYWRIYNNYLENLGNSCIEGGGGGSHYLVYNNVCIISDSRMNSLQRGFEFDTNSEGTSIDDWQFYNNTFTGLGYSAITFNLKGTPASITNIKIKNNIFYDSKNAIIFPSSSAYTQANFDIDYNLVNAGAYGGTTISIDGSTYMQAHPRSGVPQFVTYNFHGAQNLRLSASDTTAKENGTTIAAMPATDYLGISRPQGSAWDIGAYEFVGKVPNVPNIININ